MNVFWRIAIVAVTTVFAASCGAKEKVTISLTGVEPRDFDHGLAGECVFTGHADNPTDQHVDEISFKVNGLVGATGEIFAKSTISKVELIDVKIENHSSGCAEILAGILDHIATAEIYRCKMDGVPEGQCQEQVTVLTTLTRDDVTRMHDTEEAAVQRYLAPLTEALKSVQVPDDDAQLLDAIVKLDSKSWFFNRYDDGSMTGAAEIARAPDGSWRTVQAYYTYNGGQQGWVKATLYKGMRRLPCLEFHDFAGSCRDLRLPTD